jgi:hypothetical protein
MKDCPHPQLLSHPMGEGGALDLIPEPHPFLETPTVDEVLEWTATPDGVAEYAAWLKARERKLWLSDNRPLEHGFEPAAWKMADSQVAHGEVTAVFGANRTTKSWWAAKRVCEAARAYGDSTIIVLAEKDEAAFATTHKWVWFYLRPYIQKLNMRRGDATSKVTYTQAGGFANGKLVLPNRTEIYFLTYRTSATDYEGWEPGAPLLRMRTPARRADGSVIENIGWWADESLSYDWLEVLSRRSTFRRAKGLWTFTPVRGITPAIKQFLGEARVIESARAELLPRARVNGCPDGHMPVVVEPAFHQPSRAVYFHLGANPFGEYTEQVRKLCEGRNDAYIERVAYGWARDSVARQFGNFGTHNIVKVEHLPARGTNYQINDPHDERPWFSIWVRVVEGLRGTEYWIYRDWPDCATYGEWATETERETSEEQRRGWDGDPGPAQANLNLGVIGYKRVWAEIEAVRGGVWPALNEDPHPGPLPSDGRGSELDPYRRALQLKLKKGEAGREEVFERLIDSRAGPRPHVDEQGQLSPVQRFAQEDTDEVTKEVFEGIDFKMASGQRIDLDLIRDLLEYRRDAQGRITMMPRLFVAENCKQVIWALENYTGKSGETGACKDVIDVLRYMASGDLIDVTDRTFCIRSAEEIGNDES